MPITILAAISLATVTVIFDPFKSDKFIKFLFFASLAAFIWGCGAIVFFVLNVYSNDRPTDALRRGLFLSVFVLILVLLKKNDLLHWYSAFTALVITMLIEFLIYKKTKLTAGDTLNY